MTSIGNVTWCVGIAQRLKKLRLRPQGYGSNPLRLRDTVGSSVAVLGVYCCAALTAQTLPNKDTLETIFDLLNGYKKSKSDLIFSNVILIQNTGSGFKSIY